MTRGDDAIGEPARRRAAGPWRAAASGRQPAAEGAAPRPRGIAAGLLALLAICLVPAAAGAALYLHQLRQEAVSAAYADADLIAIGTNERLRWLLQDAEAMMASVAARPKVRSLDPADCDPILADFHAISPGFKTLSLRLVDGRSLCSELRQPPSQQSVAASPWFQAAIVQPGFHVSDGHLGAVRNEWTVRLTYPVADASGRRSALLVAPVDLAQLQQRLFAQLPAGAVAAIVDASSRVLVRSQRQDERIGRPVVESIARILDELRQEARGAPDARSVSRRFAETGFDGVRRLYVARSLPLTGWTVVAAVPEEDTLRGYVLTRNRSLAAIALVLAAAGLAAWRVSRGIRRPIQALAAAARGVAAGQPGPPAPETGPTELREVAREFNQMVRATAAASEQLRRSERQVHGLLQHLPVAVVSHRPDGAVEYFNDRACALLRMSPAQMTGTAADAAVWHFVDAQGDRVLPRDYPVARVLATRQPLPAQTFGITGADGDTPHTWVMATGYPQLDDGGRLLRAIISFVDVTAQRETDLLRLAKESAEAASRAKSAFLSRLSHELRTPLNAINGFSQLMLADPQLQPERRQQLGHVLNAGEHLLSLINQVLDISSIESGQQAALQPLRLLPLVEECVAICHPLAQARGVALTLAPAADGAPDPASIRVLADPTRLRQVLMNLLSNAIKYNRSDGRVTVDIGQAPPAADGTDVCIAVADTGEGLSPSQLERLFEPFNRLGAERTRIEGQGLGLAHSQALAQAMSGSISVTSRRGEGSCFTLRLRGAPAEGREPGRQNAAA